MRAQYTIEMMPRIQPAVAMPRPVHRRGSASISFRAFRAARKPPIPTNGHAAIPRIPSTRASTDVGQVRRGPYQPELPTRIGSEDALMSQLSPMPGRKALFQQVKGGDRLAFFDQLGGAGVDL